MWLATWGGSLPGQLRYLKRDEPHEPHTEWSTLKKAALREAV